ncbi:putative ferric reductase like transmembrane component protein [Eutypa lata UCREL1]|uniref:ferric-chelate reductase (NADPH) n=1 Tax=Eutypa lata (strain UCR-EL1) TaxID=1287681 RepID=M7SDU6_EUTLA|nr:putative ferric reductase like transmembrane component protein [Eutypa lata UCREL1]
MAGFTSVGHAVLVLVYVALNIIFQVYGIEDLTVSTNWSSRFGWMAAGNFVLVVFLALKNTPLAFLTAYSYERLNGLHQIAGYTAFLQAFLHGVIYVDYFARAGRWEVLHEDIVLVAYPLLAALVLTVLAGMILRRFNYEAFYIIHVLLFIVIIITLGLHRPNINPERILIATLLMASMWVSDRLIRFTRLVYNSVNNAATVYPLPNGGTRIVFKKSLSRARPGKHCYVWIPQIRAFETHPFTIASTEPLELVVNTYSGFTRDLHNFANTKPGTTLRASLEGPYGTNPDPISYDKVVLVAGGSGATFTFGLAADMLRRMNESSKQQIDFIWTVRRHASTDGASTRRSGDESDRSGDGVSTPPKSAYERETEIRAAPKRMHGEDREKDAIMSDSEQSSAPSTVRDLPLVYGRPDTEGLIREAVQSVSKDQRVFIAACGPTSLIEVVRNTTASCIRADGPAVELHCEQFGW